MDSVIHCGKCGYEAAPDDETWNRVDHPPLGSLTQCPECESTNVHRL